MSKRLKDQLKAAEYAEVIRRQQSVSPDPEWAEAQRRNRELFPDVAEFVDKVRAVFGPDVKVTYFGPARGPTSSVD